jgi:hypothetical protein
MRKRAGEKATNEKARRRKSDQSKSMPAENSVILMQCVRPMRKPKNHKGIYKEIQSKSVPVQTGINHGCGDNATL